MGNREPRRGPSSLPPASAHPHGLGEAAHFRRHPRLSPQVAHRGSQPWSPHIKGPHRIGLRGPRQGHTAPISASEEEVSHRRGLGRKDV